MTVTAELVAFCDVEIAAARERLRIEVRALDLPDTSDAGGALMRLIAAQGRFSVTAVARAYGVPVASYVNRWKRIGMPSPTRLRDGARAHLLASLMADPRVSFTRGLVEIGEYGQQIGQPFMRRTGARRLSDWRKMHSPNGTLAAWRVLLLDHIDALRRLSVPAKRIPRDIARLHGALRAKRAEVADLEAELALVEAA